ncbi:MAG: MFS transporter [bacterium]
MLRRYFSRFPLMDRVTHYNDFRAAIFFGVFNGLALPFVPIIARRLGMSSTGMAVMLSMSFVGSLFNLYFGHLSEQRAKMPFVFWPGITSRLLFLGIFFVHTPFWFLIIMSLYYLISTIPGPAYASIMKSNYSDFYRGRLMGNIRIAVTTTSAICAYLAGRILEWNGQAYRWLFPLAALFGIMGSLAFRRIRVRRERREMLPQDQFSFLEALRSIRSDRLFLIYMALFFLCAGPNKLVIPIEPIRLVDELHMDYHGAGLILGTVTFVFGILGYYIWGRASANRDPFKLTVLVLALSTVRLLVLALATDQYQLIIGSITQGLSNSGFDFIPMFTIMRFAGDRKLSLYIGFHSTMVGIRGIIGPFLGNFLFASVGLTTVQIYWLVFALTALGVLAMYIFVLRLSRLQERILQG